MSAKQMVFETEQARKDREEMEVLQAALKAKRDAMKQNKGVSCEVIKTAKGPVGFRINGLGIPKFFYKQQAQKLLGNTEEAAALRASILAWVEAHTELTDKE